MSVLVLGTARSLQTEERIQQQQPETFESGWFISTMYDGATP